MSCEIGVYSPSEVGVYLATHRIRGFADNTLISISRDSPLFTSKVNADGTVSRTNISSQLYKITLHLHNGSEDNKLLTYISQLDRATNMGKFPLMIKDHLGSSLFSSATTWIETMPDIDFDVGASERRWVLASSHGITHIGGSYNESGLVRDLINIGIGASDIIKEVI